MSLKTYTLSVSLAAIIGLLVTIAPLVRSVLEYRSPQFVEPNAELASLETFVLANKKAGIFPERKEWEAMYETTKAQHVENVRQQVESMRSKAAHNVVAYGTLCGLCVILLVTHLLWTRRPK